MQYALLCLLGMAVGVSSGLLGIGGGVILVPGLMLLFGFTQPEAQGTSLAVMIPPIGIFAAVVYYQHGFVKLPVVSWVALGFVVGAWLGAKLVPAVPISLLRLGFGALLLYTGFNFVFSVRSAQPTAALPAGVATVVTVIVSRIVRRPPGPRRRGPAPDRDVEYHI